MAVHRGAARRVAIDAARARGARPVEVGAYDLCTLPTVDNVADRVVDVHAVRAAMPGLSQQHREVLFEVFFRDAAPRDIARRLGIPEGTVKSRTFYALRSLAGLIGDVAGEPRAHRAAKPVTGRRAPARVPSSRAARHTA